MKTPATIPTPYGPLPAATLANLDTFTRAYLVCALWSSSDNSRDDGGDPLDRNYSLSDLAPEALAMASDHCRQFQEDNASDLASVAEICDDSRAGHDFWLNRNGHGSGFWDEVSGGHPLRDAFNRLSDASKAWGTSDAYVGDDGRIYLT